MCMYTCTNPYIHICVYACTYAYTHVCVCIYTYACTIMHMHVCTYMCAYAHIHLHIQLYMYNYTYMHTHMYMNIDIHVYTRRQCRATYTTPNQLDHHTTQRTLTVSCHIYETQADPSSDVESHLGMPYHNCRQPGHGRRYVATGALSMFEGMYACMDA